MGKQDILSQFCKNPVFCDQAVEFTQPSTIDSNAKLADCHTNISKSNNDGNKQNHTFINVTHCSFGMPIFLIQGPVVHPSSAESLPNALKMLYHVPLKGLCLSHLRLSTLPLS
jgi:hypothetical protein